MDDEAELQRLFPGLLPKDERDARRDICQHPYDRQARDGMGTVCLDCGAIRVIAW